MERRDLEAKRRTVVGKKVKKLRQAGVLPGVVYARAMDPLSVTIDSKKFEKIISGPQGRNVLINLLLQDNGNSESISVITQVVDRDPMTDRLRHVDFHKILLTEKIKAKVHVELVGVPKGVKDEGGVMVQGLRELEVRCLPTEIPEKFTVNIADLAISDSIHVSQLPVPAGIELLTDLDAVVVMVSAPTKDEEPAAPTEIAPLPGEPGAAPAEGAVGAEAAGAKGAAKPDAKGGAKPEAKAGAKPEAKAAADAGKKAEPAKKAEGGKK